MALYASWGEFGARIVALHDQAIREAELTRVFFSLWPVCSFAAGQIPFDRLQVSTREHWWNDGFAECLQQVQRGQPVDAEQVGNPELFVWRLFSEYRGAMTVPQRTAAMLGLLDWYRSAWLVHRDEAFAEVRQVSGGRDKGT